MKHQVVPTVNVYVIKANKLLLGRRQNTGWMDGWLCPPGGHVEAGETPTVSMVREIEEELGVSVKPEDLEFLCVAARNNPKEEHVAYEFVIRDKNYEFINAEPDMCSELVWVDIYDPPKEVIEDFKQIIQQSLVGGKNYLEIGY